MRRDTRCVVILLAGVLLTAPAGAADVHIGVNIGTPTPVVVVPPPPPPTGMAG